MDLNKEGRFLFNKVYFCISYKISLIYIKDSFVINKFMLY